MIEKFICSIDETQKNATPQGLSGPARTGSDTRSIFRYSRWYKTRLNLLISFS